MNKLSKEEFKKLIEPFKIKKLEITDLQFKKFVEVLPKAIKFQQMIELQEATETINQWCTDLAA